MFNVTWDLPLARAATGLTKGLLGGWQLAAIGQMRSGPPLTRLRAEQSLAVAVAARRIGPGHGLRPPELRAGAIGRRRGHSAIPTSGSIPTAFVLQPAGTLGNLGRGALIGPDLRVLDLALVKRVPWSRLGPAGRLEFRVEAFNVFNRANFGVPSLTAFAGTADNEAPLPTLGRIRNTITSARQVQLGLRVAF